MAAQSETVTIKTVTMVVSVICFTATLLFGFTKIVDAAVKNGVENAIEKINLRQTITDQKQDNQIESVTNETRSNSSKIDKLERFVYIENSRK